ncbi:hypothetical protein HID58_056495, partial [Brassica napus]
RFYDGASSKRQMWSTSKGSEFVPHLDGDSDNIICYLKSDHTLHQRNDKDIKLSRLLNNVQNKGGVRKAQMSSIRFIDEIFPRFGICLPALPPTS